MHDQAVCHWRAPIPMRTVDACSTSFRRLCIRSLMKLKPSVERRGEGGAGNSSRCVELKVFYYCPIMYGVVPRGLGQSSTWTALL